jgi:hypothetical protein
MDGGPPDSSRPYVKAGKIEEFKQRIEARNARLKKLETQLKAATSTSPKYIDRLKSLLTWCDPEKDLPVHCHAWRCMTTRKRGRVDALTQDELHRVVELDFRDTDTRKHLLRLCRQVSEQSDRREE